MKKLLLFLLTVVTGALGAAKPQHEAPPNILLICIDDLRPELGCYGVDYVKSPCLDTLAKEGMTFMQAHCQQAICNPSRASLLTGLRPDSLRVWDLRTDFRKTRPNVVTLPQHFKQHGYGKAVG